MRWHDAHDGSPNQTGYVGQVLVGQVARYDDVRGEGPGWVGFVHGHRVTGRCSSAAEARAAVAAARHRPGRIAP